MPGIAGLITKMPREWAEPQLARMLEAIRHESFYSVGSWTDDSSGTYVGWAERRNSFSDGMPLRNETGEVVLVFSGEEFPQPDTARSLTARGHILEPEGPSYLVHTYEEDPCFPRSLNGRFHGLVADQRRRTSTLFNDRYGMHRVYYHESKDAFYFATEAKAILAVRPELRRADPRGLGEYVACGCVLENRTLFEGIHVLPPGSRWVFHGGAIQRKGAYFQPREWEEQDPLDAEAYYRELQRVFSQNLPRYFHGRERIGMSLTGGLDTRMIMAWQKSPPGSLPCYSFGGMFRECQDVRVGRQVARTCGQPHEVIHVGKEFLSRFPYYAERTVYLTDGCAGVFRSPDLYVNEKAREIAPVRMTGNYGSEVLRAVRAFRPMEPDQGLFRSEFLSHVHGAGETYASVAQRHPVSFAVFLQAPWHHYGLLELEQTQLAVRSPFLDNDLVRTVFRAPREVLAKPDACLQLIADGNVALRVIRTDRGLRGNHGRLTAALTRFLLEFTVKAEYAYDYGMPQGVARVDHLLSRFHPERLFLGWHKFNHFRVWYRDALSNYVQEMLLDRRTLARPYLDGKRLESMVARHIKGDRNYTTAIHQILTLEHVHRLFLDAQ